MSMIAKILSYSIDLNERIDKTPLVTLFATEDDQAHRFELTIHRSGAPVDLTGVTVEGYYIRCSDKKTERVKGNVEDSEAGKAVLTLNKYCYLLPGKFILTIKLVKDGVKSSVFHGEGGMLRSMTDRIEDDERIILGIDDILAHIDAMEAAEAAANEAAGTANAAAATAQEAARNADTAADRANAGAEAAERWADATVTTVTLEAGEDAEVSLETKEDGSKELGFSIPRGESGVYIGPDEPKDPTVMVWIDEDGDPDGLPEGITQEDIQEAVDNYLTEHPVTGGATAQEAAQIQANTEDIATLKTSKAEKNEIPTVPTTLPNPQALTINGTPYDGSKAVDLTIEGGTGGGTGADGEDGFSPTVTVEEITGGHRVNITDVNGTKTFDVMDGEDGKDGATGPAGAQGPAGADGYTPVKGTDYWTATDKAEMVNDVLAALPTWEGGSY